MNTNPKAKGKAKETTGGNGRVRQNRTLRQIVKREHLNGNRWWKKLGDELRKTDKIKI